MAKSVDKTVANYDLENNYLVARAVMYNSQMCFSSLAGQDAHSFSNRL